MMKRCFAMDSNPGSPRSNRRRLTRSPGNDWYTRQRQVRSRDEEHELRTRMVYASFDQSNGRFPGEGACSTIAAMTARWFLTHPRLGAPNQDDLDQLIESGAAAWRRLCADSDRLSRFPNGHFDIETVIEAGVGPVFLSAEKSHVGFFQAAGFGFPDEDDVSIDRMWGRICDDVATQAEVEFRVYIVSWNDHFFVMKAGKDAFYLVDSLGARLSVDCRTGYALVFDAQTRMVNGSSGDADSETVAEGRDCCKEFLKKFLFATVETSLKKYVNDPLFLFQKLQIEFHCVTLRPVSL